MFDPEQLKTLGQRPCRQINKGQTAGAHWVFALDDRAVFEEAAEARGQVVEIAGEVVGFELPGDNLDDLPEAEDVLSEGELKRGLQYNCTAGLSDAALRDLPED